MLSSLFEKPPQTSESSVSYLDIHLSPDKYMARQNEHTHKCYMQTLCTEAAYVSSSSGEQS